MRCPGSVQACADLPDESSKFADEGTAAHFLASECLGRGDEPFSHLGRTILVSRDGAEWLPEGWAAGNAASSFLVDQDMCLAVRDYVDYVRGVSKATGGALLVEQRLPISSLTGESGAHGTADAVILAEREIIVIDLKYGRGVAVSAADNEQLQIYALAALREFGLAQDFDRVRMVIHQPRLGAVSEAVLSHRRTGRLRRAVLEELPQRSPEYPRCAAQPQRGGLPLVPRQGHLPGTARRGGRGFSAPRPRRRPTSAEQVLADCMAKVDLIEGWCKAVRAEVEDAAADRQAGARLEARAGQEGQPQVVQRRRRRGDAQGHAHSARPDVRLRGHQPYQRREAGQGRGHRPAPVAARGRAYHPGRRQAQRGARVRQTPRAGHVRGRRGIRRRDRHRLHLLKGHNP
jgi:hypothetical protein